jgi:hypothetical protein
MMVIGIIQIVIGVLMGMSIIIDFYRHGGIMLKARPTAHTADPNSTILMVGVTVSLTLGGYYLVNTATACIA